MVAICGHPGFPVRGGLKAEIREGHGAGQEKLVTASRRESGRAQGESDGELVFGTAGDAGGEKDLLIYRPWHRG